MLRLVVALAVVGALTGCGGGRGGGSASTSTTVTSAPGSALLHPAQLTGEGPPSYDAVFQTTKGSFRVHVTRAWAPRGADRFYNLVGSGFYDGMRFFRVVPGFVVQFGIHPKPAVAQAWQTATIPDDPVKHSNVGGTLTFATAGPNTRTTQVFINLGNNAQLDGQGFAPFGRVTSGMGVIAKLYSGYGEQPTSAQGEMTAQGDAFVRRHFPKLDRILEARIVG